ncbi:MAG: secretion protein HlyD [Proteobacteria bacterium]|nr:secretion protein HlyD [Pseudomonadota bacterium]
MKNKRLIIIAGAVVVVAALAYQLFGRGPAGTLTLYGNVDIRSVNLGFRVPGRIATMPVDEGARVKAGEVLARLDTQPLTDALNAAEAALGVAGAELEKRKNGNRSQDIAQAEALVAQRRAALAQAQADDERRTELVKSGAVSQAVYLATHAAYLAAQAQLHAAEESLSLQRAGWRSEDIAASAAQRAQATAQRDKARTDLADATLYAPSDGTILTRASEPGAIVAAGETVFVLTIDRPMRVRAYVAEADLGRISPGMSVLVTTDGNPKTYHGTIGFISPAAEFTPKTVQTQDLRTQLVYRLRVIVTDPDELLRQGQPVTVSVPGAHVPAKG